MSTARSEPESTPAPAGLQPYVRMLEEYFEDHPIGNVLDRLDPGDLSAFRRSVYQGLVQVPFGEVISYGELARRAGSAGAGRAVGQAVGANPLPLFIPCHRVIRTDGALGGFSAGREWKVFLLRHEGQRIGRVSVRGPDGEIENSRRS
jgi:methylated-DNA-[protein]-cysteine S-methyltransferase